MPRNFETRRLSRDNAWLQTEIEEMQRSRNFWLSMFVLVATGMVLVIAVGIFTVLKNW